LYVSWAFMDRGSAVRNPLPTRNNKPHTTQHTTTRSRPTQQNTHEQCIIAVRERTPLFKVCVINTVVYVRKSVRWAGNVAYMGEKRHGYCILVGKLRDGDRLEEISEEKNIIFKWILK